MLDTMSDSILTLSMPLLGYLLGSIPFALLVGSIAGVDLRRQGTGNVGAGNLTKLAGLRYGLVAAILDGLKGLAPVLVARRLGFTEGVAAAGGVAAVIGHDWSLYLKGRAGRGMATSVGVLVALAPSLLVWTGLWAVIGWWIGGGLGGFVGWALLGPVAKLAGHSTVVVMTVVTLAIIVFLRRAQGRPGDPVGLRWSLLRVVWDTDRPSLEPEEKATERPTR
jgi:acyl phosphate:glycerol-3-phosphate acyltransferase